MIGVEMSEDKIIVTISGKDGVGIVAEIASVLQVSESRVCQIHSKAMLVLKHSLQDYMTR